MDYKDFFQKEFNDHILTVESSKSKLLKNLNDAIPIILSTLKNGGKLLIFGNGGSASDSLHFAAELSGKFKRVNRKPLPAISLVENLSSISAIGNDFSFDQVFSRQIKAYGRKKDLAIGISTSGKSKNVILGLKEANKNNLKTIAFTGKNIKYLKKFADVIITVDSEDTARIQEMHIMIIHMICGIIDKKI